MKTAPNKQQIHRTLKELWHGGLVVGNRVKAERYGQLPCWEVEYQLSGDVYRNWLITECNATYRKVDKAKHGINFFGSIMTHHSLYPKRKSLINFYIAKGFLMQKVDPI